MKRDISIYLRKNDGIYIIPYGVTTQGFSYQTEPYEFLPSDADSETIWHAAQKALGNTNRVVPHPSSWDVITPWFVKAGVKKWRDFAAKAKAIGLTERDEEILFRVLHWDGRGFEGVPESKRSISKDAPLKEKLVLLEKSFADAKLQ